MLGKKTASSIDHDKDLQDILGDLQDGVVAADPLRRIAASTPDHPEENGVTYGLLYAAHEQHRAPRTADDRRTNRPPRKNGPEQPTTTTGVVLDQLAIRAGFSLCRVVVGVRRCSGDSSG